MTTKPAIVLVHGAWHNSGHFSNVTHKLNDAGYQTTAVDLSSVSMVAVDDALHKDAAIVKAAIKSFTSAGRNVVVMMHSYGGVAGGEGVAAFMREQEKTGSSAGRVVGLFYIAALILEAGTTALDEHLEPMAVDLVDGLLYHLEPYNRFYNTTSVPVARSAMSTLRPHVANVFTTSTTSATWKDYGLPVTYLVCEKDRALPAKTDVAKFVKRLQDGKIKDLVIRNVDCDHTPWLSAEDEFMKLTFDVLHRSELVN